MRTPAGKECRYYYEDFHRGRDVQECRLIQQNPESMRWRPQDCTNCPVPEILQANASKDMELKLTVKPRVLGMGRKLELEAWCLRHKVVLEDPRVGCPECNKVRPGLDVFREALSAMDDE